MTFPRLGHGFDSRISLKMKEFDFYPPLADSLPAPSCGNGLEVGLFLFIKKLRLIGSSYMALRLVRGI